MTNDRTTTACARGSVCACMCVCLQADQGVMWRKAHIRYMREGGSSPQLFAEASQVHLITNPLQSNNSESDGSVSDV